MSDWIATFPAIFKEADRCTLVLIEKTGFQNGLQRAAEIAACHEIEDTGADSLCRDIAREIAAEKEKL